MFDLTNGDRFVSTGLACMFFVCLFVWCCCCCRPEDALPVSESGAATFLLSSLWQMLIDISEIITHDNTCSLRWKFGIYHWEVTCILLTKWLIAINVVYHILFVCSLMVNYWKSPTEFCLLFPFRTFSYCLNDQWGRKNGTCWRVKYSTSPYSWNTTTSIILILKWRCGEGKGVYPHFFWCRTQE